MRELIKKFDDGETLREYCCFGDVHKVENLLSLQEVDINSQNKVNGWTALHWAAKRGYLDICELLLANGASCTIPNASGQLPVDLIPKNDRRLLDLLVTSSSSGNVAKQIKIDTSNQPDSRPKCAVSNYSVTKSSPTKVTSNQNFENAKPDSPADDTKNSKLSVNSETASNYSSVASFTEHDSGFVESESNETLSQSSQNSQLSFVPSYMSRVKPPTSALSSYSEDYTYPWTKPNSKNSTPSSTSGSRGVANNGVPGQHISHSLPLNSSAPQLLSAPNNVGLHNNTTFPNSGLRITHQRNITQTLPPSANSTNPDISLSSTGDDVSDQPSPLPVGNSAALNVAGGSNLFSSNESMPIAPSSEVQFYMDRQKQVGVGGQQNGTGGLGYRILKVRVSDQCDKDFVEIDLPSDKLSIQGFLEISCQELGLEYPVHIERIRKMPNTRLRRDIEVERLNNYQELELVLSKHPVALPVTSHHHHQNSMTSSQHHHPLSHSHSYLNNVNNNNSPNGSRSNNDVVL